MTLVCTCQACYHLSDEKNVEMDPVRNRYNESYIAFGTQMIMIILQMVLVDTPMSFVFGPHGLARLGLHGRF
ncbi:Hypothetical protein FKW44_017130 [Caligus rogercresseyi]|uniref:Uncharacterized protein n=1 Tax=Caligus rogercresseyi TaxID=217165 RepID=A0A7T8H3I0_CALRO|nr:Hypothetical protein FKW44_017130 [Caligus rogercresseyi]